MPSLSEKTLSLSEIEYGHYENGSPHIFQKSVIKTIDSMAKYDK